MRTNDEILARARELRGNDDAIFGFGFEAIAFYLPFALAKEFLEDTASEKEWDHQPATDEAVENEAKDYMTFAIEKAIDHRGISANRSTDKMKEWMWLLGKEPEIDWSNYPNYGAPILKQICALMEWNWPDHEGLNNMALGERCSSGCNMGCA